ncbi:MAG: hypothetical protein WC859_06345 [Elusimicrobiota bacterium]|jgi:hypothetical protein
MRKALAAISVGMWLVPGCPSAGDAESHSSHLVKFARLSEPVTLSGEGKKNPLPSGGYFTWRFDKKPEMGMVIVILQAYSNAGKKETPYEITGEYGMPEMRMHDSGPVPVQLNKKGDYLLPVQISMPGSWQIVLRIKRAGKPVLSGKIDFAV